MKTKSKTLGYKSRALTFSVWEDLGLLKLGKMNVALGFEVNKGFRLNAMERVDTTLITVGPFGLTYSRGYLRKEEES